MNMFYQLLVHNSHNDDNLIGLFKFYLFNILELIHHMFLIMNAISHFEFNSISSLLDVNNTVAQIKLHIKLFSNITSKDHSINGSLFCSCQIILAELSGQRDLLTS